MKYLITLFFTSIIINYNVFSQEKNITHKILPGETVQEIAKTYNVSVKDIYKFNPDTQLGLKNNTTIIIPKGNIKYETQKTIAHEVVEKETLYGIEKKYNVSNEILKKNNPFLEKDGLQIGQVLTIPVLNNTTNTTNSAIAPNKKIEKEQYHEVLEKETKFYIAKKYGLSIAELEAKNPDLGTDLQVGYKLLIKGTPPFKKTVTVKKDSEPIKNIEKPKTVTYASYEVQQKETLYGLSKKTGMSVEDLQKLNPILENGMQEGMILKIPTSTFIVSENKTENKKITTLSTNNKLIINKKLALLLPFSVFKMENEIQEITAERIKNDKFLNMSLDFYSGALIAIDSAKRLGINVDVSIFDSQETKSSSIIPTLIKQHDLFDYDAIIGPFYQNNVEKIADLLKNNNVAIISPLSKDTTNSFKNIYQTVTPNITVKKSFFDYLKQKQGVSIAVIDKKKESTRNYYQQNYSFCKIAPLTETGGLNIENFKALFVKNKMNYVILETESTQLIQSTINTMLSLMTSYNVQLVTLDINPTLDFDEINFNNLIKLKLMYPSALKETKSYEISVFEDEYRKKNKVYPSLYAIKGFDVTFDTLQRLAQDKSFQETAENIITQQVATKFEYVKKENGGYINRGTYILYYDTDLTVKEAN